MSERPRAAALSAAEPDSNVKRLETGNNMVTSIGSTRLSPQGTQITLGTMAGNKLTHVALQRWL